MEISEVIGGAKRGPCGLIATRGRGPGSAYSGDNSKLRGDFLCYLWPLKVSPVILVPSFSLSSRILVPSFSLSFGHGPNPLDLDSIPGASSNCLSPCAGRAKVSGQPLQWPLEFVKSLSHCIYFELFY